ncbi:MAG: glycosyltransferase family A protein [Xanthobacteraceae bacterium]|jgi:glycosyltransferase involved in cell wall biosynthesis
MPTYNSESSLLFAVESVLCQTLCDFQLIIVDDASCDGTADLLRWYCGKDDRIAVVTNTRNSRNGHIEWEPRNDGLKLAQGSLIAYLDDDNTWEPTFLEVMTAVLFDNPTVMLCYCNSRNFYSPYEKSRAVRQDARVLVAEGGDWAVFSDSDFTTGNFGRTGYIDTNAMVHRASVFRRLSSLWRTWHPNRCEINRAQGAVRPDRRHNDLDFAERIVAEFGRDAVLHCPQVLINFYYPSYNRRPASTDHRFGSRCISPGRPSVDSCRGAAVSER